MHKNVKYVQYDDVFNDIIFNEYCYLYFILFSQGCYSSICEDGMLKIIIENATFTCHESGQIIDVALIKDEEWLHEGSIICPSCTVGNLSIFLK